MQPCLCERPVAGDGERGDLQDLGGFFDAEATEESQFHDFTFAFVDGGVRYVADSIPKATLDALATREGHEAILAGWPQ